MAVYVDKMRHAFGRMIFCHMVADSVEELHAMADIIGLKRNWFQDKGSMPHYDICLSKRKRAIKAGATVINRHDLAALIRRLKGEKGNGNSR
jgi:hypothetical protein